MNSARHTAEHEDAASRVAPAGTSERPALLPFARGQLRTHAQIMALQRAIGNRAMARLLARDDTGAFAVATPAAASAPAVAAPSPAPSGDAGVPSMGTSSGGAGASASPTTATVPQGTVEANPGGSEASVKVGGEEVAHILFADPQHANAHIQINTDASGTAVHIAHDGTATVKPNLTGMSKLGVPVTVNDGTVAPQSPAAVPFYSEVAPLRVAPTPPPSSTDDQRTSPPQQPPAAAFVTPGLVSEAAGQEAAKQISKNLLGDAFAGEVATGEGAAAAVETGTTLGPAATTLLWGLTPLELTGIGIGIVAVVVIGCVVVHELRLHQKQEAEAKRQQAERHRQALDKFVELLYLNGQITQEQWLNYRATGVPPGSWSPLINPAGHDADHAAHESGGALGGHADTPSGGGDVAADADYAAAATSTAPPPGATINTRRKRTGAERRFMRWALKQIAQKLKDDPDNTLLKFLVTTDPKTGKLHFKARTHLSQEPTVQAGHRTSFFAGLAGPEYLFLEDSFYNQMSNWTAESKKAVLQKEAAVLIDGVPVDARTAKMWESEEVHAIPRGTVANAPRVPGWAPPPTKPRAKPKP